MPDHDYLIPLLKDYYKFVRNAEKIIKKYKLQGDWANLNSIHDNYAQLIHRKALLNLPVLHSKGKKPDTMLLGYTFVRKDVLSAYMSVAEKTIYPSEREAKLNVVRDSSYSPWEASPNGWQNHLKLVPVYIDG